MVPKLGCRVYQGVLEGVTETNSFPTLCKITLSECLRMCVWFIGFTVPTDVTIVFIINSSAFSILSINNL